MKRVWILVLSALLITLCSCDINSVEAETNTTNTEAPTVAVSTAEETTNDSISQEKAKMAEMFAKYGTYYDDGYFRFSNSNSQYDSFTIFTFSYNPSTGMFTCSHSVYTYTATNTLVDGGSVSFMWGDMTNAYYYGYHALYNAECTQIIDIIEFQYSADEFKQNMQVGDYRYEIINNTFSNLSTAEKNLYAVTCFDYILLGANYSQGIISAYNNGLSLWQ